MCDGETTHGSCLGEEKSQPLRDWPVIREILVNDPSAAPCLFPLAAFRSAEAEQDESRVAEAAEQGGPRVAEAAERAEPRVAEAAERAEPRVVEAAEQDELPEPDCCAAGPPADFAAELTAECLVVEQVAPVESAESPADDYSLAEPAVPADDYFLAEPVVPADDYFLAEPVVPADGCFPA